MRKTAKSKNSATPSVQYEPYENCPFCKGRGCFGCKERKKLDESAALKARQAEERLQEHLLFSARYDNPEEMATLTEVFHADRLREFYDSSDLTEEDVLKELGKGDVEAGKLQLLFIVGVDECRARPLPGVVADGSRIFDVNATRQLVIDEVKRQIAAKRGDERMREALRGKPGANLQT